MSHRPSAPHSAHRRHPAHAPRPAHPGAPSSALAAQLIVAALSFSVMVGAAFQVLYAALGS